MTSDRSLRQLCSRFNFSLVDFLPGFGDDEPSDCKLGWIDRCFFPDYDLGLHLVAPLKNPLLSRCFKRTAESPSEC